MKKAEQTLDCRGGIVWGAAMMMLASAVLTGCGKKADGAADAQEPVSVKEMVVGEDTLTADGQAAGGTNYSGTVEEENGVALSFAIGGTIKQLRVKVGDRVRRGQLIASVDPTSVKNAYDMAHATHLQAEDAFKRMKQLHDKGSLPDIKWVEAQSQLQQAVAAENVARKNVADCNLYSPTDGIISEKLAEAGQNTAPGMPIAKLVTTRVLNVKIAVPESEISGIKAGQHATIKVQALNGRCYSGHVVEKGVIADPMTRSYSVKIRVESAADGLLPGMVSSVSLAGGTSSAGTVVIPARLVQLGDDNSNFVWIDNGGKAVRCTIVCGGYQSNGVTVVSGLQHGDRLIVEGQQKVCSGTPVKTK